MKVRSRTFLPLFVLLAGSSLAFAADPTQAEQNLFKAIKDRIVGHKDKFPSPVSDILDSLDQWVTKTVTCPKGTKMDTVEIKIKTKLVAWVADPKQPGIQAQYKWHCVRNIVDKKKTETCENEISLDAAALANNENNNFDKVVNESILYHELLHGQKLIAAFGDSDWIKRLCDCEFPLYPAGVAVEKAEDKAASEKVHAAIRRLQDDYLVNVGQAEHFSITVRQIERASGEDGSFSVDLDLAELFPDGKDRELKGNVLPGDNVKDMNSERQGDKIHITGKLIDKTKPGNFRFVIDPGFNAALIRVNIARARATRPIHPAKTRARPVP